MTFDQINRSGLGKVWFAWQGTDNPWQMKREMLSPRYRALGLVTNAVVLWNTLYMQEALSWMCANGEETGDEDIARLSPLMHGHINMLGHYTFTLPEDILKGELRALNFNLNNELPS